MSKQTENYIALKPLADRFAEVSKSISDEDIRFIIKDTLREKISEELSGLEIPLEEIVSEWFEDGKMVVVTRDTFGIAMKATYGVIDGKKLMIYKDPKTDTSHLKKSHKGCCRVYEENGELKCKDQLMEMSDDSLLTTVFKDGKLVREDTFMDIRNRMYGGKS